jgi:hypothetical protein
MRYLEIIATKPLKPLTPPQSRIAALKRSSELTKVALKHEREVQKRARALQQLQNIKIGT